MSESGYRSRHTLHLAEMRPHMTSFACVALIIAKSEPNVFLDKLSSEQRGVICFTLRDTRMHIANCKCWGSKASVEEYTAMLQIGDVVDIVGAKVMAITPPNMPGLSEQQQQQRYQPRGTLSCALVVNEGQGYLVKHNGDDASIVQPLRQLIHVPHKPLSSALKLADVRCAAPGAEQRPAVYVDLLVVVAAVRPVRELKRKLAAGVGNAARLLHCLELVVIDTSCADGMVFTIWHPDWIRRAQYWQPRKTLLHLIDVRLSHSQFYGCPVLSLASCTLIYEQPLPQSAECQALLLFAASTPLQTYDIFAQTDLEQLPAGEYGLPVGHADSDNLTRLVSRAHPDADERAADLCARRGRAAGCHQRALYGRALCPGHQVRSGRPGRQHQQEMASSCLCCLTRRYRYNH